MCVYIYINNYKYIYVCVSVYISPQTYILSTLIYLHDLEGAVGCVEELELLDGALRDSVEGGPTPAPLHQANWLCCKQTGM